MLDSVGCIWGNDMVINWNRSLFLFEQLFAKYINCLHIEKYFGLRLYLPIENTKIFWNSKISKKIVLQTDHSLYYIVWTIRLNHPQQHHSLGDCKLILLRNVESQGFVYDCCESCYSVPILSQFPRSDFYRQHHFLRDCQFILLFLNYYRS